MSDVPERQSSKAELQMERSQKRFLLRPYLVFALCIFLGCDGCCCGGCGNLGARKAAKVEVEQTVTSETLVTSGSVTTYPRDDRHVEPSMTVNLNIPDGSKVLQFKNPMVDITFYCAGSTQSVNGIKCQLSAGQGNRLFTFRHSLTSQQQQTLQKVVVKRIYEGTGG